MTTPAPNERVDVAVAGAGFAGLALAISCADAGLRVAALERRPDLAPEGVALQLQPNGLDALDALGLGPAALTAGYRIAELERCDPSGRVRQRLSYDELDHPHPYLLGIERPVLTRLLAERLPAQAGCAWAARSPAWCTATGAWRACATRAAMAPSSCSRPFGGEPFQANVVDDDAERTRLWELADQVFPAFARFRVTAARDGRAILILQLVPRPRA